VGNPTFQAADSRAAMPNPRPACGPFQGFVVEYVQNHMTNCPQWRN